MADWQVSDLALCVNNSDWNGLNPFGRRLTRGAAYKVLRVTPADAWVGDDFAVGLVIDGPRNVGPDGDWHEGRFIKVTPPAADADDREVIALLTGKPVEVG